MNLISLKELSKLSDVLDEQDHESLQLLVAMKDFVKGISIIDEDGRYRQVNPYYAEACGYAPDEMKGMKWENTVDETSMSEARKLWDDMVRNNRAETTLVGKRKDGVLFTKKVILYLKRDRNGKHNGHFCFMYKID